jgi:hypothetical protein
MERLVGIDRAEISKKCLLCGKGVFHERSLMFYRVTLERFMLDLGAIKTVAGLEMQFGGSQKAIAVADVFSPDNDLAKRVYIREPFIICDPCAMVGARDPEYTPEPRFKWKWLDRLWLWWYQLPEWPRSSRSLDSICILDKRAAWREEKTTVT